MIKLTDVDSFGGIDADTDTLLERCFEDHEAYQETKYHKRFLVLGRKGSGKTAIYRKFVLTTAYNVFTFGHNFTDYPWHYHDKQIQIGVPQEEGYVHSWRYLILLAVAKILLNHDQSQPWSETSAEDIEKLETFVIDSYGTRDPDVTQIFSPVHKLRFDTSLGISLFNQVKATVAPKSVPIEHLPTIIQDVNRNLTTAAINAMNPGLDYYVCFDQLDLGFDPQKENYSNRLIGLILAARDINLLAKEAGKKFSTLVFLRDDIYQTLRFEDKNKITEASVKLIEWDTDRTKHTLKDLMQKRFALALDIEEATSWDSIFDEKEQMSGHQSKYQHMLDRTFLRPRDMIKFCNETLKAFKTSFTDVSPAQFSNRDINTARSEYSEYILKELDDEIFKHLPDHDLIIEMLKSLDSLKFEKVYLEEACRNRPELMPKGYDANLILKKLFDFSLIAYYAPGGGGYGGSKYIWKYKDSRARFNESATRFKIHPGFKEVLGLKKFVRSR